jgi:hypothetical protein
MLKTSDISYSQNKNSILMFLFFVIFFGCLSLLFGQDVNPDLMNYHFYNGYAVFHHRFNYDLAPALMQTYLNPFFDCINYLLISLQRPMLTAFLLGTFSGIIGFLLYEIANIIFQDGDKSNRRIFIIIALGIGLSGAASVALVGTTTNDTKMTAMVMLSLYLLLKANQSGDSKFLYFAGFTAGLVLAFKLVAVVYFFGLVLALWFADLKKSGFIAAAVCGFLVADGYWMWILFQNFHSPIYPLYNNIFHSPYAPFISFNMKTTAAAAIQLNFADYLLMPLHLGWSKNTFISGTALRDIHLGVIFLLTFIFVAQQYFKRQSIRTPENSNWTLVITFFMASYVLWLVMLTNYRYSIPLEILSGLVMIFFAVRIFSSTYAAHIFLVAIMLAIGVTTVYPDIGHSSFQKDYFSVAAPSIPSNAEVLIKTAPVAYVVPFFPSETQFVGMMYVQLGVNEDHLEPVSGKLFSKFITKLNSDIKTRSVYTLGFQENDKYSGRAQKILKLYGFSEDKSACLKFSTNIGDKLELCPVHANVVSS